MTKVLAKKPKARPSTAAIELPEVREATPEEGWALFDEAARSELGISGDEFIHRWFSGY